MADVEDRLKRWISAHACGERDISCFRAFHSRTKRQDVAVEVKVNSETNVESIMVQLLTGIEDDAANLGGGLQHYMVYAYGPEDKKIPGRFPVKINLDEQNDEEDGIDSEPPNATGLLRQLMRHIEAIQRTTTRANESIITTQARTIRDMQVYITDMEKARIETLHTREELALQSTENDIKLLEANTKQEFMKDAWKQFMPLLPIGLNALASWAFGNSPFPVTSSPLEQAVVGFVESLKEEEMQAVARGLSMEHQAVLFALVQQIKYKKEREAKAREGTSHPTPPPSRDG